jgi:hypothetical protein
MQNPIQKMIADEAASSPAWETLEMLARAQVQGFIQHLLEDADGQSIVLAVDDECTPPVAAVAIFRQDGGGHPDALDHT